MTGNELLDVAVLSLIPLLLGGLFGLMMIRLQAPVFLSVVLSPVVVPFATSLLVFTCSAVALAVYGHPSGHHPLEVATAQTVLLGPGFAIVGVVPSMVGCGAAYFFSFCWKLWTTDSERLTKP